MSGSILRFRTFRGRLAFVFLSLFALVLAASFFIALQANRRYALRQIETNLRTGARIFSALTERRLDQVTNEARLLASDYGFKQAFGTSGEDRATIRLAMQNWRDRVKADFIVLVSLEGQTLYDSDQPQRDGLPFDLPGLITAAEENDALQARGLALRQGKLFAVVVVPLLAPAPVAWIGLGFHIDDAFAAELGALSKQSVSFLERTDSTQWVILASTFDVGKRNELQRAMGAVSGASGRILELALGGERFVTLIEPLDVRNGGAAVALQRNLKEELAPFRALEAALLFVGCGGLVLSAIAVAGIARSISGPVLRLAESAHRIEGGDYTTEDSPDFHRADELGQLTRSFQNMTAGLSERDKVRDLLGKVTSPAIAAELTRGELTFGGEEKKVTILFSDLRDFTALSEQLTPPQLLEILNAYFTRMSRVVDTHGGVIDKYIGDAIMALFGAPLNTPDQARRAIESALEMRMALNELNRELLAGPGRVLRFGVGIHTATVVAGNIGSPQRYNYTVIGDGVNVASRLQALTRKPEYDAEIIVSDATLSETFGVFRSRQLGDVAVKGKQQLVGIHALLGRSERKEGAP